MAAIFLIGYHGSLMKNCGRSFKSVYLRTSSLSISMMPRLRVVMAALGFTLSRVGVGEPRRVCQRPVCSESYAAIGSPSRALRKVASASTDC